MLERVPKELKSLKQWIVWKMILRGKDTPTKVPFQIDGRPASSTDPPTWNSFEAAIEAAPRFSGPGFVFSADDPYCGIDFDACRDPLTGEISEWARTWIKRLDSYSEISPSETGIKVWIKAKMPETGKKVEVCEPTLNGKKPAIEAYDRGRYFAVTGRRLANLNPDPQDRQGVLDELHEKFFKEKPASRTLVQGNRLSVIERAGRYLDTIPGAISGQSGHNQTYKAACVLILGFGLTKQESAPLMIDFNRRCEPKWTDRELQHKLDSADKQSGTRGYLRDAKDSELSSIKIPEYREPQKPKAEIKIQTLEQSTHVFLDRLKSGPEKLISLGIPALDRAIDGGVSQGEIVIISAFTSHGKSAFALQCIDALTYMDIPCAIVSEEMNDLMLGKRVVQYVSELNQEQWHKNIEHVETEITRHFQFRAPCYVVHNCRTADVAAEKVRKLVASKGVKAAAIDYAQLLRSKGVNRYEQITNTSIALKQLTTELGITTFVLCQLSRAIEAREKFIPKNSDLADSGQLEKDASVILHLVWPWKLDATRPQNEYQIWIGKNQNRAVNSAMVSCQFNPARQRVWGAMPNHVQSAPVTSIDHRRTHAQTPNRP